MPVTRHPPHRSRRAELPHRAPASGQTQWRWSGYGWTIRTAGILNDSKIIIDDSWIEVTSDNMMNDTEILESTWVKKIIGQSDKMFGYLVHRSSDRVYVGILGENTIKLSYHYVPTEIIGQNDKMFGNWVYRRSDQVFAGIINKTL